MIVILFYIPSHALLSQSSITLSFSHSIIQQVVRRAAKLNKDGVLVCFLLLRITLTKTTWGRRGFIRLIICLGHSASLMEVKQDLKQKLRNSAHCLTHRLFLSYTVQVQLHMNGASHNRLGHLILC